MFGMGTGVSPPLWSPNISSLAKEESSLRLRAMRGLRIHHVRQTNNRADDPQGRRPTLKSEIERSSPRPISTAQLKGLPPLHLRPINQLVLLGSYPVIPVGDLILGWASHLDAFSAYPFRTWLPGGALGRTTGALAVRPTRSSRTEVSSPQISCAHSGYDPNCLTTF